jgi:hypothetical protein
VPQNVHFAARRFVFTANFAAKEEFTRAPCNFHILGIPLTPQNMVYCFVFHIF